MRKRLNIIIIAKILLLSVVTVCQAKWRPSWVDYITAGNKQWIDDRIELGKLEQSGIASHVPLRGLRYGEQLAWYDGGQERGPAINSHER